MSLQKDSETSALKITLNKLEALQQSKMIQVLSSYSEQIQKQNVSREKADEMVAYVKQILNDDSKFLDNLNKKNKNLK